MSWRNDKELAFEVLKFPQGKAEFGAEDVRHELGAAFCLVGDYFTCLWLYLLYYLFGFGLYSIFISIVVIISEMASSALISKTTFISSICYCLYLSEQTPKCKERLLNFSIIMPNLSHWLILLSLPPSPSKLSESYLLLQLYFLFARRLSRFSWLGLTSLAQTASLLGWG